MPKGFSLSNGRVFSIQADGITHFKEMLARYDDGQIVEDANDHSDLVSLLERYDLVNDGPSKIGVGVRRFEKRKTFSRGFPTHGFWVVRIDGSDTDFSYKNAVTGRPKPQSQEFWDACHNAVVEDLRKEKARQFDRLSDQDGCHPCDLTGEPVTFKSANLCHAFPSFGGIVSEFRRRKGWTDNVPTGVLSVSADRQISTELIDTVVREEFRQFHHSVAILRIVASSLTSRAVVSDPAEIRRPIRLDHLI